MKKYALKTKMGESIAYTIASDLSEAKEKFSKIKVLPITELLMIFIIELVG